MRPGYTQIDVTYLLLAWGGAIVGLQHLGRIGNWPHTQLGISLGIYPLAAREIAWVFSGGRSGDPQAYSVWP